MPESSFAAATVPLFADGLVDVVEWSFDMGWGPTPLPPWLESMLDDYAADGRLDGHGVSYSLFSQHPRQQRWLELLDRELGRRPYRRVSEHLGFMASGPFDRGTPLPMPRHPDVVRVAQRQALMLSDHVGSPIGLENLATSLAIADATEQGGLADEILGAVDGWLILDLHNLWCQAVNFDLDPMDLLDTFPATRVRELHVSGGSWWSPPRSNRRVRRDTHDGPVPPEVLELLTLALDRCPLIDTVILERIGWSFGPDVDDEFRDSFRTIRSLCGSSS